MKFNKKVVICMIMILSMLLGGCGTSLGSSVKKVKLDPDNPTKVTIWHYYNGDQLEAFNKLIDEFNGSVGKEEGIYVEGAFSLALGIAIQNFPEGAIISMPLRSEGMGKTKAFIGGVLSGIVEPIGAVITILAAGLIVPALPYLLSFAAGAMLYVVVEELIPEMSAGEHSNIGTIFFAVGFTLMMILDVALG